jgi:gliding motility-associated-like protein
MRILILLFSFLLFAAHGGAQPPNTTCATALLACAQQPLEGSNNGGGPAPVFCDDVDNAVWFTFNTNSLGGPVSVLISDLDCPDVAGMDSTLSVVVLSGNPNCNLANFDEVSPCEEGDQNFSVISDALMPQTQYWVVVAGVQGPGSTLAAQCNFTLWIEGEGANIVGVDFGAGPDQEIGQGESTQLEAFGGPPYDWSPLTGLSTNGIPDPLASPESTTIYTVTTEIDGCTYTDEVTVEVFRRIDPPNTFTPNGDGINDTWEIVGIRDYPGAEVLIYDRWGQRVFRSNGYREPWDGTNSGRALPVGTYYYHIQLNQLEGRSPPYTGFISIVR